MQRIEGVFLTLKPVAGQLRDADFAHRVVPGQLFPPRKQRRRLRAKVGEQQAAELLNRVAGYSDFLFESAVGPDRLLEGLLNALAGLVVEPAVIHAAQAVLLGDAVGEVDTPVSAKAVYETERPRAVLVEDEVLAEQPHQLGGPFTELRGGGNGVPVAAHQLAHGGAFADSREGLVVLNAEHRALRPSALLLGSLGSTSPTVNGWRSLERERPRILGGHGACLQSRRVSSEWCFRPRRLRVRWRAPVPPARCRGRR